MFHTSKRWGGPLVYDNLETISTHLEPKWRKGMYGCWGTDPRGKDSEAEPFEIPMQGLRAIRLPAVGLAGL